MDTRLMVSDKRPTKCFLCLGHPQLPIRERIRDYANPVLSVGTFTTDTSRSYKRRSRVTVASAMSSFYIGRICWTTPRDFRGRSRGVMFDLSTAQSTALFYSVRRAYLSFAILHYFISLLKYLFTFFISNEPSDISLCRTGHFPTHFTNG